MAKSKFSIKIIVSTFLAVIMLFGLTVTASAIEPLFSDTSTVTLQLKLIGTTAYCTVSVEGAYGTTDISDGKLVLKNSTGGVVESWDDLSSSSDSLYESRTVTGLTSGAKYTLIFSANVNRNGKSESISKTVST